jgi:dynein heavy chain 2
MYSQLQLDDKGSWSGFSHNGECENSFPVQLDRKLSPFQKVLVVQAVRPDRLHSALVHFALQTLGTVEYCPL